MKKQVDPKVKLAAYLNKKRKKYRVMIDKEIVAIIQALNYDHALEMAQTDFPDAILQVKHILR